MSTLSSEQANNKFEDNNVILVDIYLFMLFAYIVFAALISGLLIFLAYKRSHKIEVSMIKKVDYSVRLISTLQLINMLLLTPFAASIWFYTKMLVEFVGALLGFFEREHHFFRWITLTIMSALLVINILFMRNIMSDIYCLETDQCDLNNSLTETYLMYSQYTIGFILEVIGMILISNLMMSLGWFYTKRFPPQLNLERYGVERPKKKSSIYDLFPHPMIYD